MKLIHAPALGLSFFLLSGISSCDDPSPSSDNTAVVIEEVTLESLNEEIINDPNEPSLYKKRGRYHRAEGNFGDAFRDFERAIKLDSLDTDGHYLMGALYYQTGQMGQAKYALEESLSLDPNNTEAVLTLAEVYFVLTNHDRSMRHINDALKIDDQLHKGYFLKGLIYKEQKNYELAKSSFQTVTELDPENVEAFNLLGMLYAEDGDSLAVQYYETALTIDSTNMEVLYNRGYYYQDRLMADEAVAAYNVLLKHYPESSAAYYNKGYVLMGLMSRPEEAIDAFTEAIRYNPDYYQAYTNRGVCLEEMGRVEQAIADYEKAIELHSNFEPAVLGLNRLK